MERMNKEDEINNLYNAFHEEYGYISISRKVVEKFVSSRFYNDEKDRKSQSYMLDLMKDWAIAAGYVEGVEL